jgi:hypothetical protein
MHEVIKVRTAQRNINNVGDNFYNEYKAILFLDYILSLSLCFVELYDTTNRVEKFYATRNRFIAGRVTGESEQATAKYIPYLTGDMNDIINHRLRFLKLKHSTKTGYSIVQPRTYYDARSVRVTPAFFTTTFVNNLSDILEKKVVRFNFVKDNMTQREISTTLNRDILMNIYKDSRVVDTMLEGTEAVLDRGFIRIPEIGLSKYDKTGVRALNVTRIVSIEYDVDVSSLTGYINVDYDSIVPNFNRSITGMHRDPGLVTEVYKRVIGAEPTGLSCYEMIDRLLKYVDSYSSLGTTTFLRRLHDIMIGLSPYFGGYTGAPMEFGKDNVSKYAFNLGTSDEIELNI